MKSICYILYVIIGWFAWGPLCMFDGLVYTVTLSFYKPFLSTRLVFWAWDHLRKPFLSQ